MTTETCYGCKTTDFHSGLFSDLNGVTDGNNAFCLDCAVKREEAGGDLMLIPTTEQMAAAHRWWVAGIGTD